MNIINDRICILFQTDMSEANDTISIDPTPHKENWRVHNKNIMNHHSCLTQATEPLMLYLFVAGEDRITPFSRRAVE